MQAEARLQGLAQEHMELQSSLQGLSKQKVLIDKQHAQDHIVLGMT